MADSEMSDEGENVKKMDTEMAKEDDSDGDEVDSSSEENSADEAALTQEIEEAEATIDANPYLYDQHVLLIEKVKKIGDLEKLRRYRQRMSEIFPLTEALWLDWIHDEIKLAVTDEEKDSVGLLFESAVKDYLSVEVWLEYAQFSIGRMGTDGGIEKCREVFERAIVAAGLHVAKGCILWEAYREFENAVFCTMQPAADMTVTAEQQKGIDQQRDKVTNLFKRQLSVPLLDMEKTCEEFKEWLMPDKLDSKNTYGYGKALAKLKKISAFEETLFSTDTCSESAYLDYINFELKDGEPARVICLYERAIVQNCLSFSLWEQYTNYLNVQLKDGTVVLPAYERAIRNCPWSLNLWLGYLKALERYNELRQKIKSVAERALSAGFTSASDFQALWLAYLEYLRRQIDWKQEHVEALELLRTSFQTAHNFLMDGFGYDGDPNCNVLQYWARIEAMHCKNMARAREIWNDILSLGHTNRCEMWLEFCTLERMYGDTEHLRKLFLRALQAASDNPEAIGQAWLNLERDAGTLEQFEVARKKIDVRIKTLQERKLKEAEQNALNEHVDSVKRYSTAKNRNPEKRNENVSTSRRFSKPTKRKLEESGNVRRESSRVDKEGFRIPQPLPSSSAVLESDDPQTASKKQKSVKTDVPRAAPKHGTFVKHNEVKDECTVFLSNLSFAVEEDGIREFLSEVGEIKDVRIVRNYSGRSKGYCYVEFSDWDVANKALSKDRQTIDGRPVFVSKYDNKEKRSKRQFKYSGGLEKNKLFVKGLPLSVTSSVLTEMFRPFGELKDVRLVTYRGGDSKGMAYVDYKTEESAALALVKMDGTTVENRTISVALSNPPERKTENVGVASQFRNQSNETGQSRRSRTNISLLPRSLMMAKEEAVANGSSNSPKPMSNDDFRNLLLKK